MLRWKRVEISAGALLLGAALYYLDEQLSLIHILARFCLREPTMEARDDEPDAGGCSAAARETDTPAGSAKGRG